MGQDWARCQRMIHQEHLRYEQLKDFAARYNVQAVVTDPQSAFRAIEQILLELFILQKKYLLHLNPSDLNLPFIRFLLKWSFSIGGKAKLNALLQEMQGYNDTIERTLALCCHPPRAQDRMGRGASLEVPHISPRAPVPSTSPLSPDTNPQSPDQRPRSPDTHLSSRHVPTNQTSSRLASGSRTRLGSRPISPREYHVYHASPNIAVDNHRDNTYGYSSARTVSPSVIVSRPPSSTINTHFPSYSGRQTTPTGGRPTSISYTRASPPTPSNATNICSTSWFGSTRTYTSRERDDNCSGPLHREYSSSSSRD